MRWGIASRLGGHRVPIQGWPVLTAAAGVALFGAVLYGSGTDTGRQATVSPAPQAEYGTVLTDAQAFSFWAYLVAGEDDKARLLQSSDVFPDAIEVFVVSSAAERESVLEQLTASRDHLAEAGYVLRIVDLSSVR